MMDLKLLKLSSEVENAIKNLLEKIAYATDEMTKEKIKERAEKIKDLDSKVKEFVEILDTMEPIVISSMLTLQAVQYISDYYSTVNGEYIDHISSLLGVKKEVFKTKPE